MDESPHVILNIEEIYTIRDRKKSELDYYNRQLAELQEKMTYIRKEIVLTETIIRIVEADNVLDLINGERFLLTKK